MIKNYVYRMHHDTGFAPHIDGNLCFLSGCKYSKTGKRKNIEEAALPDSWIIGIGGNKTMQANKIIYIMEVLDNISREQYKTDYPLQSKYILPTHGGTRVLMSKNYYYFGDNAINVPSSLKHIMITTQGCKLVQKDDIEKLKKHLKAEQWRPGSHGEPNNPDYDKNKRDSKPSKKCA